MKLNKKILILIIVLIIIIGLLFCLLLFIKNAVMKNNQSPILSIEIDEDNNEKIEKQSNKLLIEKLSGLSEQKRIEYYATEFIKALEGRKISTAYKLLNEDFKKNYFNTEESFGKYVKTYFPKEVSVKYVNMERLENLYVLEVEIKDILNSDEPNHFDCYIVVKENGYADYELSFSVNSAMKNSQADEEVEEVDDDENTEKIEDSDEIYENADESSEEFEDDNVIYESDDEIQEDTEEIEETEE